MSHGPGVNQLEPQETWPTAIAILEIDGDSMGGR